MLLVGNRAQPNGAGFELQTYCTQMQEILPHVIGATNEIYYSNLSSKWGCHP